MRLMKQRVGVVVTKLKKTKYVLKDPELVMIKVGTEMIPLPEEAKIIAPDGTEILASGRFFITIETIDPYHIVTDYF